MIKNLSKAVIEATYLNIIKAMYDKPTARIILNKQTLETFPLIKNMPETSAFTSLIQHSTGSPSCRNQIRNKRYTNWKEEVKLSFVCR